MSSVLLVAVLCLPADASGLDADGAGLPVATGEGTGLVGAAPGTAPRTVDLALRTTAASAPLVRSVGPTAERLVGWSAGVRLQAAYAPDRRFVMALDAPVRLAAGSDVGAGASLGDARVQGWWRPTHYDPLQFGVGVSVRVPTGAADAYAGTGRIVPEVLGSARWNGPIVVSGVLGLASEGEVVATEALGGGRIHGAVRAGVEQGAVDAGLSVRTRYWTSGVVRGRRGAGSELALDVGLGVGEGWRLQALGSRALGSGAGTAVWGGSVGVVASLGRAPEPPPPPPIPMQSVQLVDPNGSPVVGALLVFDDEERRADAEGRATWPEDAETPRVSAPGLLPVDLPRQAPEVFTLDWAPLALSVRVATATGVAVEPAISLRVDGEAVPIAAAGDGLYRARVLPGSVLLDVEAPGYGHQTRAVTVLPRRVKPVALEVVLLEKEGDARLELDVRDPQGLAIGGAEVRLDGVSVGTTGEGRVGVDGLPQREVDVAVESRFFTAEEVAVDLSEGEGRTDVGLFYAPGTVRIAARTPRGPVTDGLVYIDGPRSLPPVALEATGEKLVQLGDGSWDLALSSPAYGLQERRIEVEPRGPVPLEALFVLSPESLGPADLVVRAVDVDGAPLAGVAVTLDGRPVGTTGTGGEIVARDLPEGPVVLTAVRDGMEEAERSVVLREGRQLAVLPMRWDDGTLQVAAHAGRQPVDAQIDFAGPTAYEGGRLGDPGRRLFLEVPPGEWELLASHRSGMEVAWTTVGAADGRLADVSIALPDETGDGVLDLAVRDPAGGLLGGVEVAIDGQPLLETAAGGRVRIKGLTTGVRELTLSHPWFETWRGPVTIDTATTVEQQLQWRAGLVDVVVTERGEPVPDALLDLLGPVPVDSAAVGSDGEAIVALTSGEWEILVSSPSAGLASTLITLDDEGRPPMRVPIELAEEGLVVRVADARGRPVPGAALTLGDVEVGSTNANGVTVLPVVASEGAVLRVEHPGIEPVLPISVAAEDTERRIEVRWKPRAVPVRARHEGRPVAVRITANGPGRVPPRLVDGDGTVGLPPGRWELLASGPEGLGTVRRFLDVPSSGEVPPVTFDLSAARVRQTADGLDLIDVRFAIGADIADDSFAPVLEEIAATIVADPRIDRVEVQGHTDPTGGPEVNFGLSRRRAASIVAALVDLGVPTNLLVARGYGSSRPIADNATAEGRAMNRRVDFRITTNALGGDRSTPGE
jgi:outer membrane protein OmpA-like peptidoglycan-associated protein